MSTFTEQQQAEDATLLKHLKEIAAVEVGVTGEETWMDSGCPGRWFNEPRWRCANDHVSFRYLKSEGHGADVCLAMGCQRRVYLTSPEDEDGPLLPLSILTSLIEKPGT